MICFDASRCVVSGPLNGHTGREILAIAAAIGARRLSQVSAEENNMRKTTNKRILLATTLLSALSLAGTAQAQQVEDATTGPAQDPNVQSAPTDQTPATTENAADTPATDAADADASNNEGEIVVTGSRIASPNIVSMAPVQVVGETEIDQSGAVNIQEVLLENPAFGTPLLSRTNSAFLTSGTGVATVDLRDLGSDRTLILINNRRVVAGLSGSAIVDLNVIPAQFLERIDILTGGASSLYGSDAVAGVVNFIYKRNFEGLLVEGQGGITQKGDSGRYQISATAAATSAMTTAAISWSTSVIRTRRACSRASARIPASMRSAAFSTM
jgi:outer membrane receptor protein involved in Fe transport